MTINLAYLFIHCTTIGNVLSDHQGWYHRYHQSSMKRTLSLLPYVELWYLLLNLESHNPQKSRALDETSRKPFLTLLTVRLPILHFIAENQGH